MSYITLHNLLEDAPTITPSAELVGFEATNVLDWSTVTYWKPGSAANHQIVFDYGAGNDITADCVGVGRNNFSDFPISGVLFEYSDDNVFFFPFKTMISFTDNEVFTERVTEETHRYWRITIFGCTSNTLASHFFIGKAVDLPSRIPEGFSNPVFNYEDTIRNQVSQRGELLVSSKIREGWGFELTQDNVTDAWLQANYKTVYEHISEKAFYLNWDESLPYHAYCKANKFSAPSFGHRTYQQFSVSGDAYIR